MSGLDDCYNIFDLRDAARKRLPRGVFEFFDRGTEDEVALANNRAAFERLKLKHRALVDMTNRTMATTLFGKPASMPMAIAPTGVAGLCWYHGELEGWSTQSKTPSGRLRHLKPAVQLSETPPYWARPSVPLGYHRPVWP